MAARVFRVSVLSVLLSSPTCLGQEDMASMGDFMEPVKREPVSEDHTQKVHKHADKNSDGKISKAEFIKHHEEVRHGNAQRMVETAVLKNSDIDQDKDGKISLKEAIRMSQMDPDGGDEEHRAYQRAVAKRETERFHAADTDNDGFLTAEEARGLYHVDTHDGVMEVHLRHLFEDRDKDKDGELTAQEFFKKNKKKDVDEGNKKLFKALDLNKNGKLSQDEVRRYESKEHFTEEAASHLFDEFDEDKDGHISWKELHAAHEASSGNTHALAGHLGDWAFHLQGSDEL